VIRAECVLETSMGGAGVYEEGMTDLTNVAKALDCGRVESKQGRVIDPNVVPERIADDFSGG
jgi:hypothetical protein